MAAARNGAPSFDEMIQADRKKRKFEELATEVFRRKSASSQQSNKRPTATPSLASRVGVTKRSFSAGPKASIDGQWMHDLHSEPPLKGHRPANARSVARGNKLAASFERVPDAFALDSQVNIRGQAQQSQMSIKGKASPGPFVVIASNFAPGTTAADIEAAIGPIGGEVLSCKLVASNPTVMAEVVFEQRDGAENVIATFNNQKADGRLLYVYMKPGGPSPIHNLGNQAKKAATPVPAPAPAAVSAPVQEEPMPSSKDEMTIDEAPASSRDEGRLQREPPTGPYSSHERGYQDGRYGFDNQYEREQRRGDYRRDWGRRGYASSGQYERGHRW